jgi:repressor LexA
MRADDRQPAAGDSPDQGIGAVLRARRKARGLTLAALAAKVGCTKGYLSEIENGHKPPPGPALIDALERALAMEPGSLRAAAAWQVAPEEVKQEVERLRGAVLMSGPRRQSGGKSLDDLYRSGLLHKLVGEEPRPRRTPVSMRGSGEGGGDEGPAADPHAPTRNVRPATLSARVPLINSVAAGALAEFTDLGYPAGVADEYVRCPDLGDPDAFAARVVGDSMEPEYREGDVVIFSPARTIRDGMDCFARLEPDHESTFKRVYFEKDAAGAEMIRLQPLNARYAPRIVPREQVAGLFAAVRVVREIGGP